VRVTSFVEPLPEFLPDDELVPDDEPLLLDDEPLLLDGESLLLDGESLLEDPLLDDPVLFEAFCTVVDDDEDFFGGAVGRSSVRSILFGA
jgi:hypothetical protein